MEIRLGSVVEFFQNKEILTGVVVGTKNNRLLIFCENNKEINLSQSRIFHAIGPFLSHEAEKDKLLGLLKQLSDLRRGIAEGIDISELWMLLEGEEGGYSVKELAEFVFTNPDVNQVAALERLLVKDKFYFQFKNQLFYPRSREAVEDLKIQVEKTAAREKWLNETGLWLKATYQNKAVCLDNDREELVEKLKSFCLHNDASEHYDFVKEVFKRAELPLDPQVALQILINLKVWGEDENLLLHKFEIPRRFPQVVTSYFYSNPFAAVRDLLEEKREDLRELWTVSIDSEETKDIDDAISIKLLGNDLYQVGIHITDVTSCIIKGDPVDNEARTRMTSIYLPDEKIPMIMPEISENLCSLVANQDKRAISFIFNISSDGKVVDEYIVPSMIRVKERLTYEKTNERLLADEYMRKLYEISLCFREERRKKGAVVVNVPEVYAFVDSDNIIHLKRHDREEPSQIMVSEFMIAANALGARFFSEKNIPAIYRNQGEAKQEEEVYNEDVPELFRLLRQRRSFARAEISTTSNKHCNLGVDCYSSVTSPIRRYMDLVLHRQIKSYFLKESPPYTVEELEMIITEMNAVIPRIFYISRRWNRYWIMKYIEQEHIKETDALILDQNDRNIYVVLPDFMIETGIPKRGINNLALGQTIKVKIERVKPREDTIILKLV